MSVKYLKNFKHFHLIVFSLGVFFFGWFHLYIRIHSSSRHQSGIWYGKQTATPKRKELVGVSLFLVFERLLMEMDDLWK